MKRHVTGIDVGAHEKYAGFTLHFGEEKEHFLFAVEIAEDLATKLIKVVKDIRYVQKALDVPGDRLGVSDEVTMRLVTPKEEKEDGKEESKV